MKDKVNNKPAGGVCKLEPVEPILHKYERYTFKVYTHLLASSLIACSEKKMTKIIHFRDNAP